jgi:hypothetical protein
MTLGKVLTLKTVLFHWSRFWQHQQMHFPSSNSPAIWNGVSWHVRELRIEKQWAKRTQIVFVCVCDLNPQSHKHVLYQPGHGNHGSRRTCPVLCLANVDIWLVEYCVNCVNCRLCQLCQLFLQSDKTARCRWSRHCWGVFFCHLWWFEAAPSQGKINTMNWSTAPPPVLPWSLVTTRTAHEASSRSHLMHWPWSVPQGCKQDNSDPSSTLVQSVVLLQPGIKGSSACILAPTIGCTLFVCWLRDLRGERSHGRAQSWKAPAHTNVGPWLARKTWYSALGQYQLKVQNTTQSQIRIHIHAKIGKPNNNQAETLICWRNLNKNDRPSTVAPLPELSSSPTIPYEYLERWSKLHQVVEIVFELQHLGPLTTHTGNQIESAVSFLMVNKCNL